MFNMVRKFVVFTNRIGYFSGTDSMCYMLSTLTIDSNMKVYVGNAVYGWNELSFNLG